DPRSTPAISKVPHVSSSPLIMYSTLATSALVKPLELGANVSLSPRTQFYTGNRSSIGGILVDGGKFDWTQERNGKPVFPGFVTPDPAYHGLKYADLGEPAFGLKARAGLLRDTGATLSAFNAWLAVQGLDSLKLRVQQPDEHAR